MIKTLTSLRLIFALMVFASHLVLIGGEHFSGHIFKEGYVGVSFFFILSGFIISYNYCDRIDYGLCSKRDFWIARIARIYPLHLLTLSIAAFAGGAFFAKQAISWIHLFMSATLTSSYIPRSDFFFAMNSPAWSLCCEQLFYLLFPLIIPVIRSPKKILIISAIAIIIVTIGSFITPESYIKGLWYTNPVTRFPDFLIGVLLWHVYSNIKDRKISFIQASILESTSIIFFILFYIYAEDVPKIFRYSFYYWLPISAVIIIFSLEKGILSKILSSKILVKGGEISFGFYLIHYLVLTEIGMHKEMFTPFTAITIAFTITIITSWLSYSCFEKPMNRTVKRLLHYQQKKEK